MILPNVALFPQALLPLRIFESRYLRMLKDVLEGSRMFVVAMQKPGCSKEIPSSVAGLGLVRVCVQDSDKSYNLILQGIQRVQLRQTRRYKPYRIQQIVPLQTSRPDKAQIDELLSRVRNLVSQRIAIGLNSSSQNNAQLVNKSGKAPSVKDIMACLDQLSNPEELVDLISCALLPDGRKQQMILETADLEPRIHYLISFLTADIHAYRNQRLQR